MMLLLMFVLVAYSYSYPSGAPPEACTDIYPEGHEGTTQDLNNNPFTLNLSDFDHSYGGTFYYVNGRTYTLTLSGSGGEQFRGFLVQARTVADGSPVGAFTDNGGDQALSSCTPNESAITHSNDSLKSSVVLSWTAPLETADQLHFLYAVVGAVSSMFWAPATTDVILPCSPPLYRYQGNCVESCPFQHIGNYTSRQCQPFPTDYIISLNATQYDVYLNSETPVNTTAFHMQLSVNTSTLPLSDIVEITFSFSQTQLVQSLFEFEHGDGENQYVATNDIISLEADTGVVSTSIVLVTLPNDAYYPIDIDMTVSVHIIYTDGSPGGYAVKSMTVKAVGSIVLAPGVCDFPVCGNGGTCMEIDSTHYICECPREFTGETCSEVVDACQLLEPCVNGTCHASGALEYTCTCRAGYTGANCSEYICEGVECNNGDCMLTEGGEDFVCSCDLGYTGNLCNEVISDCYYSGCGGNGNCTDVCECFPGWTGTQCETKLPCDPGPCANNGVCHDTNGTATCTCAPRWTGSHCNTWINTSVCDGSPCLNNGTCSVNCRDSNECLSNESDQLYRCLCVTGYTGETCNKDDPAIKFCQTNTCANSATCIEEYGPRVSCLCAPGFTGLECTDEMPSTDTSCSQSVFTGEVLIAVIVAATSVIIVGIVGTLIAVVQVVRYRTKAKCKAIVTQLSTNSSDREMGYRVFSNTNINTGIYFDDKRDGPGRSPALSGGSLTVSSPSPMPRRVSEQSQLNRHRQESVSSQQSIDGSGRSPVLQLTSGSLTVPSHSPMPRRVTEQPQLSRHRQEAVSSQQSRDGPGRSPALSGGSLTMPYHSPMPRKVSGQPQLNRHQLESVSSQQSRDTLECSSGWMFINDTMSQMSLVSDYEEPVCSVRRHHASQNNHPSNILSKQYETVY